ncbi:MAG: prepilin-type N-terminal cleavage/methylation domain-containing protein [Candidatus Saccharibacteria bacterium]
MSKQITNQDQKGFTIIEVLIVLAIAALILLVVFLAIPGLQRSQRNSSRKADAGRIVTGLSNYVSNNNGSRVSDNTSCGTAMTDSGTLSQFKYTTCTASGAGTTGGVDTATYTNTPTTAGAYIYTPNATPATGVTIGNTATAVPTANIVIMLPGYICGSVSGYTFTTSSTGASSTSVALIYTQESGTAWSWNCVNAG